MSSATFDIFPIERFAGSSAAIKRPREIAHFSYDSDHNYRPDDSSINYFYPPILPADLKAGFETFDELKENEKGDEHIDSLLKTIEELEKKEGKKCEADFITWRGMMTKIMAVPFDKFSEFAMNATCYQGTIYIEEDNQSKLDARAVQLRQQSKKQSRQWSGQRSGSFEPISQEMMQYWGYKFETLALIPDTWDNVPRDYFENRPSQVVSNKAQYCSVVRTGISDSSLVLGGEVDALWDSKPTNPDDPINWVELKTAERPLTKEAMIKFERKLLKYWIQSFLLGVPRIVVGFRDKNGILLSWEDMYTHTLPGLVKSQHGTWDGNTCINFAARFLEFLKENVTTTAKYRIRHQKGMPTIWLHKLDDGDHSDILSAEFVQWREHTVATDAARMLSEMQA